MKDEKDLNEAESPAIAVDTVLPTFLSDSEYIKELESVVCFFGSGL